MKLWRNKPQAAWQSCHVLCGPLHHNEQWRSSERYQRSVQLLGVMVYWTPDSAGVRGQSRKPIREMQLPHTWATADQRTTHSRPSSCPHSHKASSSLLNSINTNRYRLFNRLIYQTQRYLDAYIESQFTVNHSCQTVLATDCVSKRTEDKHQMDALFWTFKPPKQLLKITVLFCFSVINCFYGTTCAWTAPS